MNVFFLMRKRGQFFLLAAVIISSVVLTLSAGVNRVTVNEEPDNFYDFSYEVKREVGSVLDYSIYSDFADEINLNDFVDSLAREIKERSPGSDFIFIYGNSSNMAVRNYGSESIYAEGVEIFGTDITSTSRVCLGDLCQNVTQTMVNFNMSTAQGGTIYLDPGRSGSTNVTVEIGNSVFDFPFSSHKQVIFIMKKNIGGDRHVVVK
jgi:hypothetical protein